MIKDCPVCFHEALDDLECENCGHPLTLPTETNDHDWEPFGSMSLIFIAIPTKGTVLDGKLTDALLQDIAELHVLHPSHTFLVPMIQDYQLLPFMTVDATWEAWGHHCRMLIGVCDEVWVLQYPGWDTSTGITAEIACANALGITVHYFVRRAT